MTGSALVEAIVNIIIAAIVPIGTAIGQGLSSLASSIFLQTVGTGAEAVTSLSMFGTLVIVFAAISLGFGLVRWVLNFITSLGNRNR